MSWEHLSEDVRRMLERLIATKKQLDRLKRSRAYVTLLFAMASVELAYLFFHAVWYRESTDAMFALQAISGDTLFIATASVWIGCLLAIGRFTKTIDKKDGKFEELRKEAVDRLRAAWWRTTDSGKRDALSREMMDRYKINISYKNKGK